ncbi:MAG: hypothetical protein OXN19_16185 [Caldilineaceae bacterium]|nr:hypothetical protein [Caldilineaceae bacterium]
MKPAARYLIAASAGALSALLICAILAMAFLPLDRNTPAWLFPAIFAAAWPVSAFLLLKGTAGISEIVQRAFLLGAAESIAAIPAGFFFAARAVADELTVGYASIAETDPAAPLFAILTLIQGGSFAFLATGIAIAFLLFCLLGYGINFSLARRIKSEPQKGITY